MAFQVPKIYDNPEGWGPSSATTHFKSIPYAPFNKGDKIGKIADWSGQNYRGSQHRYRNTGDAQFNTAFYFTHENDDDFQLVDQSKPQKRYGGNRRFQQQLRQQQARQRRRNDDQNKQNQQRQRVSKQKQNQRSRYTSYRRWGANQNDNKPPRDASVHVRKDWNQIEEFAFPALQKAQANISPPEDILFCGNVFQYDDAYDRVGTRTERPLERQDRTFFNVTTSDDPIIQEIVKEDKDQIFATDTILSVLMTAPRSVYSWDIIVHKVGNKLFFDKRDNSQIDFLTVNETAAEPPTDDKDDKSINTAESLSREATFINQNFSQQVLDSSVDSHNFERSNPFVESSEENVAAVAYRYRRFQLEEYSLVVRAELDGVQKAKGKKSGQPKFLTIKALNEFDPKKDIDWRQKLDTQRGAVLATELKNNSCKLARWTIQSLLAGASTIKLGFVSRLNPKSQSQHVVLGTQFYKPREFGTQINLNVKNSWGILKTVIDACMKMEDGTFVLLKDPNKPVLRLFAVPENAFDHADESDEEETVELNTGGMLSLTSVLTTSSIVPRVNVPLVQVEREAKPLVATTAPSAATSSAGPSE